MELIVAVYEDWGIGKDGTQPVALSAEPLMIFLAESRCPVGRMLCLREARGRFPVLSCVTAPKKQ